MVSEKDVWKTHGVSGKYLPCIMRNIDFMNLSAMAPTAVNCLLEVRPIIVIQHFEEHFAFVLYYCITLFLVLLSSLSHGASAILENEFYFHFLLLFKVEKSLNLLFSNKRYIALYCHRKTLVVMIVWIVASSGWPSAAGYVIAVSAVLPVWIHSRIQRCLPSWL